MAASSVNAIPLDAVPPGVVPSGVFLALGMNAPQALTPLDLSEGEAYLRTLLPENVPHPENVPQKLIRALAEYNIHVPYSVFTKENLAGLGKLFQSYDIHIPDHIMKPKDTNYEDLIRTLNSFINGNEKILIISSSVKSRREKLAQVISRMFKHSWFNPPLDKILDLSDKFELFIFSEELPNHTLAPNFTYRKCVVLIHSDMPLSLPSYIHLPIFNDEINLSPEELDILSHKVNSVVLSYK